MKHIMHDWSEQQCVTILQNIRKAIGTGNGRVLIRKYTIYFRLTAHIPKDEFVLADAGKESGIPQVCLVT